VPAYRFVTVWWLNAPIDEVYAAIDDIEAWPAWWPHVRSVERLDGGDAQGIGAIYRMTFVGRLPYRLRFDLRVMERVRPTTLTGRASGELEGTGAWTLQEGSGLTAVRYVWAIRTRPAWMNLIAPSPSSTKSSA
jgi:hypothetical protein